MGLAGVRVRVAGDDFHLLAEENTAASAAELADTLAMLRDEGGALRIRPRTAPSAAPWAGESGAALVDDAHPGTTSRELTGTETPGTAWRDIPGSAIQELETEDLVEPTVLWHWAVGPDGERRIG